MSGRQDRDRRGPKRRGGAGGGECGSTDRLSALIDGELNAETEAVLRDHVATCGVCASALAELEAVVAAAKSLPDRDVPDSVWAAVAARIEAETVGSMRTPRRLSLTPAQALAAGLALMIASSASTWLIARRPSGIDTTAAAVVPGVAAPANAEVRLALVGLDERTAAVVKANLASLDAAIADVRAALEAAPVDEFLRGRLDELQRRRADLIGRARRLGGDRL